MVKKYLWPLFVLASLGYGVLYMLANVRAPAPSRIWLQYGPVDDYGKPTWDTTKVRYEVRGDSVLPDYKVAATQNEETKQWSITLEQLPNWGNKQLKKLGHRFVPSQISYLQAGRSRDNEEGKWWLWQKQQER